MAVTGGVAVDDAQRRALGRLAGAQDGEARAVVDGGAQWRVAALGDTRMQLGDPVVAGELDGSGERFCVQIGVRPPYWTAN